MVLSLPAYEVSRHGLPFEKKILLDGRSGQLLQHFFYLSVFDLVEVFSLRQQFIHEQFFDEKLPNFSSGRSNSILFIRRNTIII